jgi:hypothetical protein
MNGIVIYLHKTANCQQLNLNGYNIFKHNKHEIKHENASANIKKTNINIARPILLVSAENPPKIRRIMSRRKSAEKKFGRPKIRRKTTPAGRNCEKNSAEGSTDDRRTVARHCRLVSWTRTAKD